MRDSAFVMSVALLKRYIDSSSNVAAVLNTLVECFRVNELSCDSGKTRPSLSAERLLADRGKH